MKPIHSLVGLFWGYHVSRPWEILFNSTFWRHSPLYSHPPRKVWPSHRKYRVLPLRCPWLSRNTEMIAIYYTQWWIQGSQLLEGNLWSFFKCLCTSTVLCSLITYSLRFFIAAVCGWRCILISGSQKVYDYAIFSIQTITERESVWRSGGSEWRVMDEKTML